MPALSARDGCATLRLERAAGAPREETRMDFAYSERVAELRARLLEVFDRHI